MVEGELEFCCLCFEFFDFELFCHSGEFLKKLEDFLLWRDQLVEL